MEFTSNAHHQKTILPKIPFVFSYHLLCDSSHFCAEGGRINKTWIEGFSCHGILVSFRIMQHNPTLIHDQTYKFFSGVDGYLSKRPSVSITPLEMTIPPGSVPGRLLGRRR